MNRRPVGTFVVCTLLAVILIVCALVKSPVIAVAVAPLVAAVLGAELDRSGNLIAIRIVRLASRILPAPVREEHENEWLDHVRCSGEAGLRPVLTAIDIVIRAAPRVALPLRARHAYGTYLLAYSVESVVVMKGAVSNRVVMGRLQALVRVASAQPSVRRLRLARLSFRVAARLAIFFGLYATPLQVALLRRTVVRRGKRVLPPKFLSEIGLVIATVTWVVPVIACGLSPGIGIVIAQILALGLYAWITARVADNAASVFRRGGELILGWSY